MHAALQLKFEEDHIAAAKELPVKNLLDYATYQAAERAAMRAHITDKGERTDRDPQVWQRVCRQHSCRRVQHRPASGRFEGQGVGRETPRRANPDTTIASLALQAGTMEDTVNPDQLIKVMIVMLGSSRRTACRDMSMALWSCQTIGRSDDARLLFLPDLLPPTLVRVIGELWQIWCAAFRAAFCCPPPWCTAACR